MILKKILAVLMSAAFAISLSGCFLLPKEVEAPELPLVTPYSGEEYITAQVSRGDLKLVREINFTYQATRTEKLKFNIGGKGFGAVDVSVGDRVKAGDLVAWLDISSILDSLDEVEAEIAKLNIKLEEAEQAYKFACEKERLQGGNNTASSDARAADAAYYRASLNLQEGKRDELVAEIESLKLYATIDGTVTYAKTLYAGAISNKSDTVVTITDTSSSVFTATTEHYALFAEGDMVSVKCDGVEYSCIVKNAEELGMSVASSLKQQGKDVVCLEIQGAETPSNSDARGVVTLEIDSRENVLMLPKKSVFTVEDRYYVYYEDENGLKNAKEVECGLENDRWIEIVSGLEEGDSVIIR